MEPSPSRPANPASQRPSSLKLSCTVHGPKALPRNAAFSPQLLLTTNVKYAPFAQRQRRGFIRDSSERDLGAHLETALKGVILGDRWPKSSVEIAITILETEDDPRDQRQMDTGGVGSLDSMNVLAGCITAASAALIQSGVDCLDLVSGGTAAIVSGTKHLGEDVVVDPDFAEHDQSAAACCVGYLSSRDELVELWMKGEATQEQHEMLCDRAVAAAMSTRSVLAEVLREGLPMSAVSEDDENLKGV